MTQAQHTTTTPIVALPEGKECQSYKNTPLHDTGTVGFVLLVFFFLALFFRGGYKYITDIANHLFSIRKRQNAFEIHTASETFLMLAMIANTCIMSGLMFYLGIDYWYPEIGLSQNVFKWVSILSSRAKYCYNESLLEITNLTVKIQKLAQHIIKLINITTFAHYMIC